MNLLFFSTLFIARLFSFGGIHILNFYETVTIICTLTLWMFRAAVGDEFASAAGTSVITLTSETKLRLTMWTSFREGRLHEEVVSASGDL